MRKTRQSEFWFDDLMDVFLYFLLLFASIPYVMGQLLSGPFYIIDEIIGDREDERCSQSKKKRKKEVPFAAMSFLLHQEDFSCKPILLAWKFLPEGSLDLLRLIPAQ